MMLRTQTTITPKSSLDRAQALAALVRAASSAILSGKSDPAIECTILDAAAEVAVAMKAERVDIIRTPERCGMSQAKLKQDKIAAACGTQIQNRIMAARRLLRPVVSAGRNTDEGKLFSPLNKDVANLYIASAEIFIEAIRGEISALENAEFSLISEELVEMHEHHTFEEDDSSC